MKGIHAALPPGYLVTCSVCGVPQEWSTAFSAGQLKKKRPRCRSCAPNKFSNAQDTGRQSRRESRRAKQLRVLEKAGLIRNLREQTKWSLIPAQKDETGKVVERACTYVSDFDYCDPTGKVHIEDAKGYRTEVYRLKRKLMLWIYGVRVEEV